MDDSLLYTILLTSETNISLERAKIKAKKGKSIANKLRTLRLILAEGRKEVENAIINTEFNSIRKEEDE